LIFKILLFLIYISNNKYNMNDVDKQ